MLQEHGPSRAASQDEAGRVPSLILSLYPSCLTGLVALQLIDHSWITVEIAVTLQCVKLAGRSKFNSRLAERIKSKERKLN